eukprot:GHVQ01041312.1.p1 GENE.GHVQ01041312.1~~GHVQ01041312.1.p1  ORF type:complete len:135 (+),score=21.59 GHVQ01041312.1:128-532(+)
MGEDDLIDENNLIDKDEKYEPLAKGKESCANKPRACANCSCGRKELEVAVGAEEAKKRLEQGAVRSSCGSCYLGDAFRCATCPYKGLPAFKGGDKVKLDMAKNNDGSTQDSSVVQSTASNLITAQGQITLTDDI